MFSLRVSGARVQICLQKLRNALTPSAAWSGLLQTTTLCYVNIKASIKPKADWHRQHCHIPKGSLICSCRRVWSTWLDLIPALDLTTVTDLSACPRLQGISQNEGEYPLPPVLCSAENSVSLDTAQSACSISEDNYFQDIPLRGGKGMMFPHPHLRRSLLLCHSLPSCALP